jgi:hypothetical protein
MTRVDRLGLLAVCLALVAWVIVIIEIAALMGRVR